MRIVELISIETTNGASRHGLAVAEEMVRRGHEVTLFYRHWLEPRAAEAAGVRCEEIAYAMRRSQLGSVLSRLRDLEVDVVHTHTSKALLFALALRLAGGPPVVATAHSQNLQALWPLADLVVAPTEAVADYQRRVNRVAPSRIRVIPSLIGAQRFAPASPDGRAEARVRLGAPADAVVAGLVADAHLDKRQSDLIRAADLAHARHPQLMVALKGAAVDPREMRRIAAAQAGARVRVEHVREREDDGGFLAALDIIVVASAREVGPFSLAEAMSAGLPAVATDVGRVRALVGDDVAGIIVRPGDLAGLADALGALAADPALRGRMGAAALARIGPHLDDAPAFDAIEAALAEAAAIRRAAPQRLAAPLLSAWLGARPSGRAT